MPRYMKLSPDMLKLDFKDLKDFKTTDEVEPFKSIIGQKRAEESIDLGLKMDKKEYHIFTTAPGCP